MGRTALYIFALFLTITIGYSAADMNLAAGSIEFLLRNYSLSGSANEENDLSKLEQFSSASSKELHFGSCPNKPTAPNFKPLGVIGKWFVHSNFGGLAIPQSISCPTMRMLPLGLGKIQISYFGKTPIYTVDLSMTGNGIYSSNDPAKINLSFSMPYFKEISIPFWILATDYSTFSLVWTCLDYKLFNLQIATVITRQQDFNEYRPKDVEILNRIKDAIKNAGFSETDFVGVDHRKC